MADMPLVDEITIVAKASENDNYNAAQGFATVIYTKCSHTEASDKWTNDAVGHWHECAGCDEKVDFSIHISDGGVVTSEPTGTADGTRTYSCTICSYVIKTETIPAIGITEPESDPVPDFVNRLYSIFLGRTADETGLADWTDKLSTGKASAAEIVHGIAASPEFQGKGFTNAEVVEKLYEAMLNRPSDTEGKANWVKYLDAGMTVDVVINGFTGSQEFAGVCAEYGIKEAGSVELTAYRDQNYNLTAFVSRMYTKALGRPYDLPGLDDWTSKLFKKEIDVTGLAYGFIFSQEFVNKGLGDSDYLDTLYRTFFNREPDEGGKSDWMNKLADGMAREDVLNGFVGSQECVNLVNSFNI